VRCLDEGTRRDVQASLRNRLVESARGRLKEGGKRKRGGARGYKERVLENMRGRHDDRAAEVEGSSADEDVVADTRRTKCRDLLDLKTRQPASKNGYAEIDMSAWASPCRPFHKGPRIATPCSEEDPVFPRTKVVVARDDDEPEPTHDTPMKGPQGELPSFDGEQDLNEQSGLSPRLH